MKNIIVWLPLAAVAGGIVGAWGPYEELRAYKERSPAVSAEKAVVKRGGFDPIAQLIKVPDAARRPRRVRRAQSAATGASEHAPTNTSASAAAKTPSPAADASAKRKFLPPEDLQARIDEAAELWRTRIKIARANALEKLGISEDGAEDFDAAVADMNDRLRDSMQAVADIVAESETLTPEIGMKLMGELTTAIAETYDTLGESVQPSMRGKVSDMQLIEFIDPSVAEPLVAVKDKLDPAAFRGKAGDR